MEQNKLVYFIRPTKKKFILFIIFYLINLPFALFFSGYLACFGGHCEPTALEIIFNKILNPIFAIPLLYTFSCLIVFIYEKIKTNH